MDDDDSSGNAGDADHEFSPDLDVSGTMIVNTSTDDAASYADRSDFSVTPPSDAGKSTERKSRRPTNSNTTNDREQRRKRSSGDDQRKSRSKRRLNDLALEQRLMALTEENQRLKVQLGANSATQNMSSKSSVIIAAPSSTTGTSILHHPLPSAASAANAIFGLSNLSTTTSVTPIQSAGSAFSVPRSTTTFGSSSITSTLTEQPNSNAFSSFFYPQQNDNLSALGLLAPSHAALLSLFNPTTQSTDRINGSAFLSSPLVQTPATPGTSGFDLPLASLANLQAILQQQQQQQALIPNFASTTPASATDPNPVDLGLQFLPSTIFASQFDRRSTETQPTTSTNAVRFNSLFHPPVSTPTNEPKKTADVSSSNDRTTATLSLTHQSTNGTSRSVTRGPGNLNFVRQLPAAQEPRPSVLMHTDGSVKFSADATNTWPSTTFHPTVSSSASITRSRIKSVERTPPRSASAFSSASSASPTNSMANGNVGVRSFANNNKTTERPQSLLGSLLAATSTSRRSPSVPESRTERQSGLIERRTQDQESIKSCMSTLAVNLSNAPTSAASSTTSTGGHPSSGRSDNDSMGSPHSTRSTSDSARSHNSRPPSPGHAHDGASTGGGSMASNGDVGDETSRERYMDRRRRNNEAAKRCRANRRAVFEYRSRRAQQLEAENSDLRQEMLKLNNELEQLKAVIAANSRLLAA